MCTEIYKSKMLENYVLASETSDAKQTIEEYINDKKMKLLKKR